MSTIPSASQQPFVLYDVPWRTYERLLRVFADRPGVHLTYDRGVLELMTLSHEHEAQVCLVSRFVEVLTEELSLPVKSGGSTTFRRRKRRRGLEPDRCWWVASEGLVRGKNEIDPENDPPPDLALEVDVTRRSLNRLEIYARLRVPEVWRLEGRAIVCYLLGSSGRYTVSTTSRAFPGFSPADLAPFLALRGQVDENAIVQQFRSWLRQWIAAGSIGPTTP